MARQLNTLNVCITINSNTVFCFYDQPLGHVLVEGGPEPTEEGMPVAPPD